jgi:hypothetical protein
LGVKNHAPKTKNGIAVTNEDKIMYRILLICVPLDHKGIHPALPSTVWNLYLDLNTDVNILK